jgi:hypothetical protein
MRMAAIVLTLVGGLLVLAGTVALFRRRSDDPRYQQSGFGFGSPPGLLKFIDDQRKAGVIIVCGSAMQLSGAVLSFWS